MLMGSCAWPPGWDNLPGTAVIAYRQAADMVFNQTRQSIIYVDIRFLLSTKCDQGKTEQGTLTKSSLSFPELRQQLLVWWTCGDIHWMSRTAHWRLKAVSTSANPTYSVVNCFRGFISVGFCFFQVLFGFFFYMLLTQLSFCLMMFRSL